MNPKSPDVWTSGDIRRKLNRIDEAIRIDGDIHKPAWNEFYHKRWIPAETSDLKEDVAERSEPTSLSKEEVGRVIDEKKKEWCDCKNIDLKKFLHCSFCEHMESIKSRLNIKEEKK